MFIALIDAQFDITFDCTVTFSNLDLLRCYGLLNERSGRLVKQL